MADLFTFTVKSASEHRDDILRTIAAGLRRRGVADPDVSSDSDYFVIAQGLALELAVCGANTMIAADDAMPDTAADDVDAGTTALSRVLAIFGLSFRPAGGSTGAVILNATSSTSVAGGAQLTDEYSQQYEVTVGSIYAPGALIPVRAVAGTVGRSTNLAEGRTLKWVGTAPAYSAPTALVAPGGFVNGVDAETNEEARARLYAYLQNPPASGNWSHCVKIAEDSTPRVQKGYAYPAVEGPASVHIAVTASPTTTNKSRDVAAATMAGTVVPYTLGIIPEHAAVTITTVANVDADVAFGLAIPDAPTASPPGPGGGWLDGAPWPSVDAVTSFRCTVTAKTADNAFTLDAQTLPTNGVTRICWLDTSTWKVMQATVVSSSGSAGAIAITTDVPLTGIAVGSYVWPACANAQAYADAVLGAFALMGPGEKTTNASALVRGFRHPRPSVSWPYTLGPHLTAALVKIAEVATASFLHRSDGGVPLTGPSGVLTPAVPLPAAIQGPPNIYRPRNLGFYRIG